MSASAGSALPADPGADQRAATACCAPSRRRRSTTAGRSSARSAGRCWRGIKRSSRPRQPVVIYPASGTGAWEAALVNTLSPGDRVLMCRDRPLRDACGSKMARRLGLRVRAACRATGGTARDPDAIEARLRAEDRAHAIKAVCVVHNETSTGVTSRHRRGPQGDRCGRPSGAAAGRHDLLARLDRLPPRRVGRRRHRRRLAEGPDAAARPVASTRVADKALAASQNGAAAALRTGAGTRCSPANEKRLFPVHAGDQPALWPAARRSRCCTRRGSTTSSPATTAHAEATRRAVRAWGLEVQCARPARVLVAR